MTTTIKIFVIFSLYCLILLAGCGGDKSPAPQGQKTVVEENMDRGTANEAANTTPANPGPRGLPPTNQQDCQLGLDQFRSSFNIYNNTTASGWWAPFQKTSHMAGRLFQPIGQTLYLSSENTIEQYLGQDNQTVGTVTEGTVRCMVNYDETLVIGGDFSAVNKLPASNIALFRNGFWESLGSTFNDGGITAISPYRDGLLVGGNFKKIDDKEYCGLAFWTGQQWETIGQPLGSTSVSYHAAKVTDILVAGDRVFVAGEFYLPSPEYGNLQPIYILELVDGKWQSPSINTLVASPECLEVYAGELVVGGSIYSTYDRMDSMGALVNERELSGIAVLRDGKWQPFGLRFTSEVYDNARVYSLRTCGPNLYISGEFDTVNDVSAPNVACWNGHTIALPPIKEDLPTRVDFTPYMGGVILGSLNRIWVEDQIMDLAVGLGDDVQDIFLAMDSLFAVSRGRGWDSKALSRWNGSQWDTILAVTNQKFYARQGELFAYGQFNSIGSVEATGIARFNGETWLPLGEGLGVWDGDPVKEFTYGRIGAIGFYRDELVAFGDFNHSGERFVGAAAVYRDGQWEPLVSKETWDSALACWKGDHYIYDSAKDVGKPRSQLYLRSVTSTIEYGDNLMLLFGEEESAHSFFRCLGKSGSNYLDAAIFWDGSEFLPITRETYWSLPYKDASRSVCLFNDNLLAVKSGNPTTIHSFDQGTLGDEAYQNYLNGRVSLDTYEGHLFVGCDRVFVDAEGQLQPLFDMPPDMSAYKMVAHRNVLYVLAHSPNKSILMGRAWR